MTENDYYTRVRYRAIQYYSFFSWENIEMENVSSQGILGAVADILIKSVPINVKFLPWKYRCQKTGTYPERDGQSYKSWPLTNKK